jgi:hypothetical protein
MNPFFSCAISLILQIFSISLTVLELALTWSDFVGTRESDYTIIKWLALWGQRGLIEISDDKSTIHTLSISPFVLDIVLKRPTRGVPQWVITILSFDIYTARLFILGSQSNLHQKKNCTYYSKSTHGAITFCFRNSPEWIFGSESTTGSGEWLVVETKSVRSLAVRITYHNTVCLIDSPLEQGC